MQYWNNKSKFLSLSFFFLLHFSLQAQENSPYSRYGIGNLRDDENAANRGMGGVSIADDNPQIVNPTNPATYTGLKLASYQVGLTSHLVTIKSAAASDKVGKATLAYVNIGFPLSKRMGFSFGLLPVSSTRYNMETTQKDPVLNTNVNTNYYGGGGMQKIYAGTAYRIKDISLGINAGYQFGNITNSSESGYPDSLTILSNNIYGRTVIGGLFWQAGALMNTQLDSNYRLKIGLTYTGAQSIGAKKEMYWESYFGDIANIISRVDSSIDKKGKIQMPFKLGAGIILAHGDNWQIGADYLMSNWKSYRSFGQIDSMANSWTFRVGGSYIPDPSSVNNYWKKMTFRLGFYTGKNNLSFDGYQLSRTAGTVGLGYPIRRTVNTIGQINAALEVGSRGNISNGLLKENFTHFTIGFTFNDKWFMKARYD
jgi:hypothetical protein